MPTIYEAEPVHEALKRLQTWCTENGMVVNVSKTKIMRFRNRGPLKTTDIFKYNANNIEITNTFTYLGLTFQTTGTTFTVHIEKRLSQIFIEMHKIKDIQLSIHTALQLFPMKLSPIMEYSLTPIWQHLTTKQLTKIDTALTTFLKYTCRVSRKRAIV
jgi:hypothetical protein